jgi:hypothetical protein
LLSLVFADPEGFDVWFSGLPAARREIVLEALSALLSVAGLNLDAEVLKPIRAGIFEFRIGPTLGAIARQLDRHDPLADQSKLLIRVACSFDLASEVLILGGLDKTDSIAPGEQSNWLRKCEDIRQKWLDNAL